MPRLMDRPGAAWALFLLAGLIVYAGTGRPSAVLIFLPLEIGFWTVLRQVRNRRRRT